METLDQPPELLSESAAALLLILVVDDRAAEKVGEARHQVTLELNRWGLGALCDTVTLLTSEMVTNAVRAVAGRGPQHVPQSIKLLMRPTRAGVRLEVTDPVQVETLVARRPEDTEESGRGLFMLDLLASQWGTRPSSGGKTVWAEIGIDEPSVIALDGVDLDVPQTRARVP